LGDQVGFDGVILFKKGVKVHHQISDHVEDRKRFDQNLLLKTPGQFLAGQSTDAIDPHPIRSADAMAAGHPERESRVLFPAYSIKTVEKSIHGICLHLVILIIRLFILHRIETEDL
jgi:hypothetical protein